MQPRLGEILISKDIITETQLLSALEYQKEHRVRLGEALAELGFIGEDDLLEVLAAQLDMDVITESSFRKLRIDYETVSQISLQSLKANKFLPLHFDRDKNLKVICNDSYDSDMLEQCIKTYGVTPQLMLAKKSVILAGIAEVEREQARAESHKRLSEIITTSPRKYDLTAEESVPTVREVNYTLLNAYRQRASDIHLAQYDSIATLQYRIDGILQDIHTYPVNKSSPLINRMKAMCGFSSNNRRIPQDGSFRAQVNNNNVDMRLSTIPSVYGESLVIRILDRRYAEALTIDNLGFNEHNKTRFLKMLNSPNGILVITGPTGSGKTSSAISALKILKKSGKAIHTIEDPVEYQIPGIISTQVNEKAGVTFSSILRALVRQDADIIYVGETRDSETAQISMEASNIGKLILSTLHTNNSIGAISRFLNLDVKRYQLVDALLGATAQVLVRKLCLHCGGKGCPECSGTGFFGRIPLQEVLVFSPDMKDALYNAAPPHVLSQIAIKEGLIPMIEDGYEKVSQGITTIEEVHRVVPERERSLEQ